MLDKNFKLRTALLQAMGLGGTGQLLLGSRGALSGPTSMSLDNEIIDSLKINGKPREKVRHE